MFGFRIFILCVYVLSLPLLSYGEESYVRTLEGGKVWEWTFVDRMGIPKESLAIFSIEQIYEEDGMVVADILVRSNINAFAESTIKVAERDKKILLLSKNGPTLPLMDYNVHPGDTLNFVDFDGNVLFGEMKYIVFKDVEPHDINGRTFRWYSFENPSFGDTLKWVEGIGPKDSDEFLYQYDWPDNGRYLTHLENVYVNGELIFTKENFNPGSKIELVSQEDERRGNECIMNLFGQKVENPKKGQIYIRGGKKIIW